MNKYSCPIKIGQILYHIIADKKCIIKVKVERIQYNEDGIYVYGTHYKQSYRFIYKTFGDIEKTHFGTEVFFKRPNLDIRYGIFKNKVAGGNKNAR